MHCYFPSTAPQAVVVIGLCTVQKVWTQAKKNSCRFLLATKHINHQVSFLDLWNDHNGNENLSDCLKAFLNALTGILKKVNYPFNIHSKSSVCIYLLECNYRGRSQLGFICMVYFHTTVTSTYTYRRQLLAVLHHSIYPMLVNVL